MDSAKTALKVAAVGEIATGLAMLLAPSTVSQFLLGTTLTGIAIIVARVAGIALIGLGIACLPGPPRRGMLVYSAAVALFLAFIGLTEANTGVLLWPAVILHVILSGLLLRASKGKKYTYP